MARDAPSRPASGGARNHPNPARRGVDRLPRRVLRVCGRRYGGKACPAARAREDRRDGRTEVDRARRRDRRRADRGVRVLHRCAALSGGPRQPRRAAGRAGPRSARRGRLAPRRHRPRAGRGAASGPYASRLLHPVHAGRPARTPRHPAWRRARDQRRLRCGGGGAGTRPHTRPDRRPARSRGDSGRLGRLAHVDLRAMRAQPRDRVVRRPVLARRLGRCAGRRSPGLVEQVRLFGEEVLPRLSPAGSSGTAARTP